MLEDLKKQDAVGVVLIVDRRGALPDVPDWKTEIHGTSNGFQQVAERFRVVFGQAIE